MPVFLRSAYVTTLLVLPVDFEFGFEAHLDTKTNNISHVALPCLLEHNTIASHTRNIAGRF